MKIQSDYLSLGHIYSSDDFKIISVVYFAVISSIIFTPLNENSTYVENIYEILISRLVLYIFDSPKASAVSCTSAFTVECNRNERVLNIKG